MRTFLPRRVGVVLAVLTAIVLAGLAVPAAATAGGGGCRPSSNDEFSLQACISNEGATAYSDMYIDRVPADCLGTQLSMLDPDGVVVEQEYYGCSLGHKGPITRAMVRGVHYTTEACVDRVNGRFCGTSPAGWF
jgi:hypothetical protein